MKNLPTTYRDAESWQRYNTLLRERFGIVIRETPDESFYYWRGHRIHIDEWQAVPPRRATAILVHGAGGHGRLLAPYAAALAHRGYRCVAPDLPGYGLTRTVPGWRADYAEWPTLIAELAADTAGPVVLFGLSMGGFTAFWAAQQAPAVRAVAVTTLLDMRAPHNVKRAARWPWLGAVSLLGFRFTPRLMDAIALPLSIVTPLRAMTTDPHLARYLNSDSLLGGRRVPVRFFRTAHQYRPQRDDLRLECPFALIHPGADTWTPTAWSKTVYDQIAADKRFVELSNGAHAPFEQPARDELEVALRSFFDQAL